MNNYFSGVYSIKILNNYQRGTTFGVDVKFKNVTDDTDCPPPIPGLLTYQQDPPTSFGKVGCVPIQ